MTRLDDILTGRPEADLAVRGFLFTEGPVWDAARHRLTFSDIPADRMYEWSPADGLAVARAPSGKSNGMTRDLEGRLIACQHARRRVVRIEDDGSETVLADAFDGARLNSPNDVVVRSDGSVYFTDPPYGLNPVFGTEGEMELPFCGLFRLGVDGALDAVCTAITPNGLAFSPDEALLYVADTEIGALFVFDVLAGGDLSSPRLFARIAPGTAAPDGVKVDREGRVYTTGPGGVWIFEPSGRQVGVIAVPELPANLAWGGSDWRDLYVTARTSLYRVRLAVAGVPPAAAASFEMPAS